LEKKGAGIENLKQEIYAKLKKNVDISVQEVRFRDLSASLVAKNIAEQLEKRIPFKRALKSMIESKFQRMEL